MKRFNAVKELAARGLQKAQAQVFFGALGVAGMLSAGTASAALDTAVSTALTTAFENAVDDATELQSMVMTPIVAILALGIIVKLVKRFGNKI